MGGWRRFTAEVAVIAPTIRNENSILTLFNVIRHFSARPRFRKTAVAVRRKGSPRTPTTQVETRSVRQPIEDGLCE